VAGTGQEAARLTSGPLPPNIRFLGPVEDAAVPALYRDARALVFTAEEDFGLTPLEAQATGRPVIALGRGGALETVTPRTGLFFDAQTPESLADAVRGFDAWEQGFRPEEARQQAERFSVAAFQKAISGHVESLLSSPPRSASEP
jgi:glycosyltransferase involved in cell wall biosynthesis